MQMNILVGMLSTLLSSDGVVKADELAEEFEISKRTVYRYIDVLSEGGIPIQSHFGRGGGWTILENYKLKSTFFTKEEFVNIYRDMLTLRYFVCKVFPFRMLQCAML